MNKFLKVCLTIIVFFVEPATSLSEQGTEVETKSDKTSSKDELLKLQPDEQYIGNKDAKVVIIEYSSLACPHCADFHKNVFPKIKENYVNKGLILYIHRNFPTNKPSLVAAALSICSGKYFKFIDALFASQNSWAFNKNYEKSLLNIAKLSGMENIEFKSCIGNTELLDKIYENTFFATKILDVKATPTIMINGKNLENIHSYKSISEKIEKELKAE